MSNSYQTSAGRDTDNTEEGICERSGCHHKAEVLLEGKSLCRDHFHDVATKRLEQIRKTLHESDRSRERDNTILKFISELIGQSTNLVIRAKFLSPWQRDQLRELSRAALEIYKRVQRNPRLPLTIPIFIYRESGLIGNKETTNTINVSKCGACIATTGACLVDEKIWIQKVGGLLRTPARVAWAKKHGPAQFRVGIELLEQENYWGLEGVSP